MAEGENNAAGNDQAGEGNEQQFFVQKVYLKDLSFESPQAPDIFTRDDWKPEVSVQVGNNAARLSDNTFETELTITVTATHAEKTIYLAEVQYAGVFTIKGFDDATRRQLLGAYCPTLIFPYIRETVSDLVMKGGFPQMVLQPINFDALYAQHEQQRAAQAEGAGDARPN
ncbi:protein-export chaperone SecB [Guyparkeria hydrothermalis]|uniref:protein-export chaperone SecB n=1 Tax=Guyparkeria hydrothermalis TaxID=923 RepID=UPI0020222347|nr:protein-export chaperone SecB [Guyparkeria hydrothermalis]MCL7744937.1 protein-export chaperone SecB [Guyparkeria hydrothermalis]